MQRETHAWRRWVGGLTVVALLVVGGHLHGDEQSGPAGPLPSTHLHSLDSHPDRPAHVESFRIALGHDCIGCRPHDPSRTLVRLAVCDARPAPGAEPGLRPSALNDVADSYRVSSPRAPPTA